MSDEINRRDLFDAISRVSLGLAATAVIADQVKAAPAEETKGDDLEPFKYDIESEKGWVGPGGSAKEATVKQLPVSQSIAGVSMKLDPGAIRELHWHALAAEWAYCSPDAAAPPSSHRTAKPKWTISKKATPGISLAATATPFRTPATPNATSCLDSTMAISPNLELSASLTGSPARRATF